MTTDLRLIGHWAPVPEFFAQAAAVPIRGGMSAALASFSLVFLRAIQQLNVIHHRIRWAVATSFAIAFAEVAVVLLVVDGGWTAAPWVGVGGAVGVTAAMTLHRWARER